MTVTAVLDLHFPAARRDAALAFLEQVLVDTRAFAGSEGVEVLVDMDDPAHVVVVERWASLAHDDAYRSWRAGAGATPLADHLAGPPTLTRFGAPA